MTDTRDPRVAELVTRLVEQAPPAPAFPDEITARAEAPRRRVAVAGVAIAAALVIASVVFVASRPKHHPAPVSPSTTTPATTSPGEVLPLPRLVQPSALAVDDRGTLYIADAGTHLVESIKPGAMPRFVARVEQPRGLAFDHEGNLYVADNGTNTVIRIRPDGTESTYAGDGTLGFAGDGGPAAKAKLTSPIAVAVGPDDALYIADAGNGRVRRVAPDGTISTFAGNGSGADTGDGGPAIAAGLDPWALAFDGAGNLDVFHFSGKLIRRIAPDGIISSLESRYASALATRPDGNVEVADYGGFGISYIAPNGTIFNLPFQHSGVFRPVAIAVAANGDTYVADDGGSAGGPLRIMRVHPDGTSVDMTPGARDVPNSATPDPRSAAAAVPYVERLAAQGKLPYAKTVRSVRAVGDFMVVSTSLVDEIKAAQLWEALSLKVGCDDSHLMVRGYHVILADGSVVAAPRMGFEYCAGT
jgi:sugar lactone lactonase YvrE